jgi:hypothetical protein
MATNLEDPEAGELWPIEERDPELVAWMRSVGIRPATRSLHRPRYVAKRRPAWLAFLLRVSERMAAAPGRLFRSARSPRGRSRMPENLEVWENSEFWPLPDRDPEVTERLRAAGVRLATASLDRPRRVAKRRPAWAAFLLTLLKVRG